MASKVVRLQYEIDGEPIPFLLHKEWRQSVRYALGKKGVLIRVPKYYTKGQQRKELLKAVDWVAGLKVKKPDILNRYLTRKYTSGDEVKIHDKAYTIELEEAVGVQKYSRARLNNGVIQMKITEADPELRPQTISTLLSRVISEDNLPRVQHRVKELNHLFFRKEVKGIRLKYNTSNWGSCSAKGNINLSSRLLFAPYDVQDYVIIHELAHLIELNHSDRFWALVKEAMPDYQEKVQWLKLNGGHCHF